MNTVIYRIHYGFQFIYQSIKSIYDWADEIIIVVSKEPWYKEKQIKYLGKIVPIINPEIIDYHINNLSNIPKVIIKIEEFDTPANQWGYLVNKYGTEYTLTLEPDMVFLNETIVDNKAKHQSTSITHINATTQLNPYKSSTLENVQILFQNQLEYWKNEFWRIPQRNRPGPVLFIKPTKEINTGFSNVAGNIKPWPCKQTTLNYGFCLNPELMLYKHLLALGFSKKIGDSIPSETWYRDKWLYWTPETKNLEISKNHTHMIPKAIPI